MKLLFLYHALTDADGRSSPFYPVGIGYLIAYARQKLGGPLKYRVISSVEWGLSPLG